MDAVTFVSPAGRVPAEVKKLVPLVGRLPQKVVMTIVALAKQYLFGEQDGLDEDVFRELAEELSIEQKTLASAFTGMILIVRNAMKLRVKAADLAKDMGALKFPDYLTAGIQKLLDDKCVVTFFSLCSPPPFGDILCD
jgi:hypothetical protein